MVPAAAGLFFWLLSGSAGADELAFKRVADTALKASVIPTDMIEDAKAACDTALCFAETLARKLPGKVRLEPVDHPDTDSIRWTKTAPSVNAEKTSGGFTIELSHFGRKAPAELRDVLASASSGEPASLSIDLRGNAGGDFERMLALAGLLIGPSAQGVDIDHGHHVEHRALEGPAERNWQVTTVTIDQDTASAALLLARLLKKHAGAELIGPPLEDIAIFLKHRLAVDHEWRLILPIAELRVSPP